MLVEKLTTHVDPVVVVHPDQPEKNLPKFALAVSVICAPDGMLAIEHDE